MSEEKKSDQLIFQINQTSYRKSSIERIRPYSFNSTVPTIKGKTGENASNQPQLFTPSKKAANSAPKFVPKPIISPKQEPKMKTPKLKPIYDTPTPSIETPKRPVIQPGQSSKIQKKRTYNKEDMAPTSVQMGINPVDQGHPITIPFLDPKKKEDWSKADFSMGVKEDGENDTEADDMYRVKQENMSKYGQKLIQTSLAESLFRNEDKEYEGDDELFFLQLPTMLPMIPVESEPKPTNPSATTEQPQASQPEKGKNPPPSQPPAAATTEFPSGFKNNLGQIPRGLIGKIYVLKSGKVKMQIGDVVYEVCQGMPLGFLQELVTIDLKKNKMNILGDVQKRMVAYPDITTGGSKQTNNISSTTK